MPTYLIERNIPNAGKLNQTDLQEISKRSNEALKSIGPEYQWHQSYVTDDKFYCVHSAPDEETIREHARKGGFPVDRVMEVKNVIDSATAK